MTNPNEPFKPQLRLIFQGSIPIPSAEFGQGEYNDLKIHLLAIDPDITLNGQIIKRLEPCCKKKPKNGETQNENS